MKFLKGINPGQLSALPHFQGDARWPLTISRGWSKMALQLLTRLLGLSAMHVCTCVCMQAPNAAARRCKLLLGNAAVLACTDLAQTSKAAQPQCHALLHFPFDDSYQSTLQTNPSQTHHKHHTANTPKVSRDAPGAQLPSPQCTSPPAINSACCQPVNIHSCQAATLSAPIHSCRYYAIAHGLCQ